MNQTTSKCITFTERTSERIMIPAAWCIGWARGDLSATMMAESLRSTPAFAVAVPWWLDQVPYRAGTRMSRAQGNRTHLPSPSCRARQQTCVWWDLV
jgi:hypothetical protein